MVSSSDAPSWDLRRKIDLPQPDTAEGAVVGFAVAAGLSYILLLVGDYNRLLASAYTFTSLSLIVSLIGGFALAVMLGNDIATFQRLELELARTVLAYAGSATPPQSDAPLAGVWRAHIAAAEESRRVARSHAYALGLFAIAAVVSLTAVLVAVLGTVMAVRDVRGFALFIEWFGFTFLIAGAGAVLGTIGYAEPVPFFESFSPRRWRRNAGRQVAVDGAVSEVAWLAEFARGARESRISPGGPSVIPSWRE
jgi:hypothetical protein